ncbi:MAG: hypothetical protein DYG89_08165 [Caldilinea sp. CFX5]|nr:hypothetical protein [Caldilinea sp. CFX5]
MYASVTSAKVQPGKLDEFLATYRASVLPIVKGFPGLTHLYVLTNANTNEGMSIAFYTTATDAERTQANGDFQKALGMVASTLVIASIERKGYEICIEI